MINQTRPFRRINVDSQVQDVNSGDYLGANGISLVSKKKGESGVATPAMGSVLAFSSGSIVAQNKIVTIKVTDSTTKVISIVRNGSLIPFATDITFTTASQGRDAILNAMNVAGYPFLVSWSVDTITLQPNNEELRYYDYKVILKSGNAVLTTTQEAYDKGVEGPMKGFAGTSFVSKLFRFSVSKYREEREIPVDSIQLQLGDIRVFTPGHGLVDGQEVFAVGFVSLPEANGYYIAEVISPTVFRLKGAVPTTGTYTFGQGKIFAHSRTVGEVGVAEKNSSGVWNYTRLGRARGFNWIASKRVSIHVEKSVGVFRLYFSGDENPFRRIELKSLGANAMFSGSGYTYETLSSQMRCQLTITSAEVVSSSVNNSGGAVASGNWVFVVRGRTSNENESAWGKVSSVVSIFDSSLDLPAGDIVGDDEGIVTSKSIFLKIEKVNTDLYNTIEIGAINYLSLGLDPIIVTQIAVIPGQTSYEYLFTGNEIETSTLDVISINIEPKVLLKNKAQAFVDNRGFLGNLTYLDDVDLTGMFSDAKYRLRTKTVTPFQGYFPNIAVGGFQDSSNPGKLNGFTFYETYRLSFRVRWTDTGAFSKCYYFSDIKIDTQSTSTDGRRVGGLTSYQMSTINSEAVPYIDIFGIDLNYLIEGVPVRDLIDRVEVMIAEMSTRTVLASGIGVSHFKLNSTNQRVAYPLENGVTSQFNQIAVALGDFAPFTAGGMSVCQPFPGGISGTANGNPDFFDNPSWEKDTHRFSFYSPDIEAGLVDIEFVIGDKIIKLNDYLDVECTDNDVSDLPVQEKGRIRSVTGTIFPGNEQVMTVKDVNEVAFQQRAVDVDNVTIIKDWAYAPNVTQTVGFNYVLSSHRGPVITTNEGWIYKQTNGVLVGQSIGVGYCIYLRENASQYPANVAETLYYPTGAFLDVNESVETPTVPLSLSTYGGGTFVVPMFQKGLMRRNPAYLFGRMNALNFYVQSICNWNFRRANSNIPALTYPMPDVSAYGWLSNSIEDSVLYNLGYNIRNEILRKKGFDSLNIEAASFPGRIQYTDINIQEANIDGYRSLAPLDIRDLPADNGAIISLFNFNKILISRQEKAIMRQYVNTYDIQATQSGIEQYVGSGKVLSRPGTIITSFGGRSTFSAFLGKSAGGDDVLYSFDEAQKVLVRYGLDGSVPLSNRAGFRTKIYDLSKFARFCDAPSAGNGIHGVWNQMLEEAIISVRCRRVADYQWSANRFAFEGDIVTVEGVYCEDFEQTERLYICLQNHVTSFLLKPNERGSVLYWREVQLSEEDFYTKETIVISEASNGYSHSLPFVNNLMVAVDDTFVSETPRLDSSSVFEHNELPYLTYYQEADVILEGEGYVTVVFNYGPGQEKLYQNIQFQCEIEPWKVDLFTQGQRRTIHRGEFLQMVNRYVSDIGTDDTNGPDDDASPLYGEYLICKFYFKPNEYQRLSSCFASFSDVVTKLG